MPKHVILELEEVLFKDPAAAADRGEDGAPRVPAAVLRIARWLRSGSPFTSPPAGSTGDASLGPGRAGLAEQVHRLVAGRGSRRGRAAGIARGRDEAAGRAVVLHLDAPGRLPATQLEWDPKDGGLDEHRGDRPQLELRCVARRERFELGAPLPLQNTPLVLDVGRGDAPPSDPRIQLRHEVGEVPPRSAPDRARNYAVPPRREKELELIRASGMREFPPRLPWQPVFYPVLNEAYAVEIARDWNTKDAASGYAGFVTRFAVLAEFLAGYEVRIVGASRHQEYWIPAERLQGLNRSIVGLIEVIAEFRGQPPR